MMGKGEISRRRTKWQVIMDTQYKCPKYPRYCETPRPSREALRSSMTVLPIPSQVVEQDNTTQTVESTCLDQLLPQGKITVSDAIELQVYGPITRNQYILGELNQYNIIKKGATLELIKTLGQGSFGSVFQCQIGAVTVALKTITFEGMGDMAQQIYNSEVNAVGLEHTGICKVLGVYAGNMQLYVIQDYLVGNPIKNVLWDMDAELADHVLFQVLYAVQYIHSRGIIHHDIKVDNVIILPSRQVKLIDFGASRHTESTTGNHVPLGTIEYCAPELLCHGDYSYPIDFWAVGVLYYEMCTGHLPFMSECDHELRQLILDNKPDFSILDSNQRNNIQPLLTSNPSKRFK